MMPTVLAIAAGLLCGLYGLRMASQLHAEAERLKRWAELLPHLALLIKEESMSLPQALTATADGNAEPDRLLSDIASAVSAAPLLTLADAFESHVASCREQETLRRVFTRLGKGSAESRAMAVSQAGDELRLMADAAQAQAARDARLWQTLGFTIGACLTILLL